MNNLNEKGYVFLSNVVKEEIIQYNDEKIKKKGRKKEEDDRIDNSLSS